MMGEKSLREIKDELRKAFTAKGRDAIQELDAEIQRRKKDRNRKANGTEALEAIKRLLQESDSTRARRTRKPRGPARRRAGTKAKRASHVRR
jgi:hypothetical protein